MKSICLALIVLSLSLLAASAPSEPPPRVIIFKNDGTVVRGFLVDTTPAAVTVRTSPKADPVSVRWSDIQRLSNKLTHQQVVDEYRKDHRELLCDTCQGEGTVKCDHCGGTGIEPSTATDCPKCHGSGVLGKCPRCKGETTIPCPNDCLKESSFAGVPKGPDGKRWIHLHKGTYTIDVSDAHIGQVVTLKNGQPDISVCPVCSGKGVIECPTCHGTGELSCPTCHGAGKVGPPCTQCDHGQVKCPTCDGTGMKSGQNTK